MKKFRIPDVVKHKETKDMINALIKSLGEKGYSINESDFPNFHRMATSYDIYLSCTEAIMELGPTMRNLKGEMVKRPEINIMKENWAQYLELAIHYGLTAKSAKVLKLNNPEEEETAFDKFVNSGIERR